MKNLLRVVIALMLSLILGAVNLAQDVPAEELAGPDGQFIEVNGASLYVIDRGEPTDPAVLLLHGFGGSTFTWRFTIDPLVEAGYRVVAFDRPPYGLADKDTDVEYGAAAYVEYTAGLMDALNIESATLIGHSAGGGVIASFALTYPERVDALVFVAGAVRVPGAPQMMPEGDEQGGRNAFSGLFDIASQVNPESPLARVLVRQLLTQDVLAEIFYANYYDQSLITPEVIEGYTQILRVEGWEGAFLKLLTEPVGDTDNTFDALNTVEAPVLLVWGEQDAIVPIAVGEAMHAYLPESDWITYAETGHLPMEERIDTFNADLIEWLAANVG